VVVQGDVVGSWTREVKIPEEWRREREKQTALTVVLRWLSFPFLGLLALLALLLLIGTIRAGAIPWKFALGVGAVASAVTLVRMCMSLDTFWTRYDTSVPAGAYRIVIAIGLLVGTVLFFFAGALAAGFAGSLYPEAVSMLRREARRRYARDAMIAGFVALGLAIGIPWLLRLLALAVPSGRLADGISWPAGIDSSAPFLFSLLNTASLVIFLPAIAAVAVSVLARHFRRAAARALLAVFFVLSFLPGFARTAPEYVMGALSLVVVSLGVVVLVVFFLRDNPLAWAWSVWIGRGGTAAIDLLSQPSGAYRLQGGLLLLVILASVAWIALESSRGRRSAVQP
jgi:hypothetical protein